MNLAAIGFTQYTALLKRGIARKRVLAFLLSLPAVCATREGHDARPVPLPKHPEDGHQRGAFYVIVCSCRKRSLVCDKCHQLRACVQSLRASWCHELLFWVTRRQLAACSALQC